MTKLEFKYYSPTIKSFLMSHLPSHFFISYTSMYVEQALLKIHSFSIIL